MSDHHLGLAADLDTLLRQASGRRRLLRWLGAAALPSAGCVGVGVGVGVGGGMGGGAASAANAAGNSRCPVINDEMAGPFPANGSNRAGGSVANALALSGIVRSDIRASLAGAVGVASGVPLTVKLVLVNANANADCATLAGHAIYLWHCDAAGRYSMYSRGVTGENYLRGVQATDASGSVSFSTIFPGCYSGRMPHLHFEVYRNTAATNAYRNQIKTSQIAFPVATCQAVYATPGYADSVARLAAISFATDMVFSDGVALQLASMTGNTTDGFVATLQVGIAV